MLNAFFRYNRFRSYGSIHNRIEKLADKFAGNPLRLAPLIEIESAILHGGKEAKIIALRAIISLRYLAITIIPSVGKCLEDKNHEVRELAIVALRRLGVASTIAKDRILIFALKYLHEVGSSNALRWMLEASIPIWDLRNFITLSSRFVDSYDYRAIQIIHEALQERTNPVSREETTKFYEELLQKIR